MLKRNGVPREPETGQSIIETLLMMPFLLFLLLNAVNFGYYFLMLINLTASQRTGAEYSIMGSATPSATSLPTTGPSNSILSVSYITYQDLTGAVYDPTTKGALQVCSPSKGLVNPGTLTERADCDTFGTAPTGYTWPTPDTDPEKNSGSTAPAFVLNRMDVAYTFTPLIPATAFNVALLLSPNCTSSGGNLSCYFHRYSEMRAMN